MCKLKIAFFITPAGINGSFSRIIWCNSIRELNSEIQRPPRRDKSFSLTLGRHNRCQNAVKRKTVPRVRKHKKRYALGRLRRDVRQTIIHIHADR